MGKDEFNSKFIEKMNKIKKEKGIKVNEFGKRYDLDKDEFELSKETKEGIQKSRWEYKKGKIYSLKEIKKIVKNK